MLRLLISCGLFVLAVGDISPDNPAAGTCLCVTGVSSNLNIRDSACGSVSGSATVDECFRYEGTKTGCFLSGTFYQFFEIDFRGVSGWAAGKYLRYGNAGECPIVEYPSSEFRSAFVATVWNIDWPKNSADSTANKMAQVETYLNMMEATNMNAVILQVRPVGDALYESTLEPWSKFLTGTQGVPPSPYFDPLAFWITEAHRRNIEVHAWLNPYRANLSPNSVGLASTNMAMRWPQYAYPYGNYLWMDPGAPVIVDHVIAVIEDILARYDVDGIHFDDYFYPYPVNGVDFPDSATYDAYKNDGGHLLKDMWRRQNVDNMVESVYNAVKAAKPYVKFSISPFGIYRPGSPSGMPAPITGFDPYSGMYADSLKWLENGWLDFFAPQLYWAEDPPAQRYSTLLDWWLNNNPMGRHIFAANGVYKMSDSNNWPVSEITRQVDISRELIRRAKHSLGNIMYSAKDFRDNTKSIQTTFASSVYPNVATIPEMSWTTLSVPSLPSVKVNYKVVSLANSDMDSVYRFVLYRKEGGKWVVDRVVDPAQTTRFELPSGVYSVKAANRAWVKSEGIVFVV